MSVLIVQHPSSHDHATPPGHPERVARIETVDRVLARPGFAALPRAEARAATDAEILRCHSADHLAEIVEAAPAEGWASLDADTHMSPGSLTAARHAAGSLLDATEAVMAGRQKAAFCAVRPCGHHAERARAMGFCLFGNVAIGAAHALANGAARVGIVDFDVHHGNGTQDIFWEEPRVFFASSHQYPLYPGTGAAHERGAHGQIVNATLPPMSGGAAMRSAYAETILPALRAHAPEIVFISAGFDAHHADPLANLMWTEEDFAWVTAEICAVARDCCGGRVVSALEGGYDLDGLAGATEAHLGALIAHAEGA